MTRLLALSAYNKPMRNNKGTTNTKRRESLMEDLARFKTVPIFAYRNLRAVIVAQECKGSHSSTGQL
jgi:hypothetical protein